MAKLNIRLKTKSEDSKTQQIIDQISAAIQSGKLQPGDSVPSERALAEQLGVSRAVTKAAYQRLNDMRVVETLGTAGRRVRHTSTKRGAVVTGNASAKGTPARDRRTGKAPRDLPVTSKGSKNR